MSDFDLFWKAYPKKVAKGDARKAWGQTERIRPDLETLLSAITEQMKSDQWRKNEGQFIPYPATWLRQERWDDELKVTLPGVVQGKPWHETWGGIVAKGQELGITEFQFSNPQDFRAAVLRGAMKAA